MSVFRESDKINLKEKDSLLKELKENSNNKISVEPKNKKIYYNFSEVLESVLYNDCKLMEQDLVSKDLKQLEENKDKKIGAVLFLVSLLALDKKLEIYISNSKFDENRCCDSKSLFAMSSIDSGKIYISRNKKESDNSKVIDLKTVLLREMALYTVDFLGERRVSKMVSAANSVLDRFEKVKNTEEYKSYEQFFLESKFKKLNDSQLYKNKYVRANKILADSIEAILVSTADGSEVNLIQKVFEPMYKYIDEVLLKKIMNFAKEHNYFRKFATSKYLEEIFEAEELENKDGDKNIDSHHEIIDYKYRKREEPGERLDDKEDDKRLNLYLKELNELIGLEKVKKEVNIMVSMSKVSKQREKMNLPRVNVTKHLVFTGNPGTGKTTVARLIAKIYKELNLLSKGHLIEVTRPDLIGKYVGETEDKTREKINQAKGGVLFIDEAYSLVSQSDNEKDYGKNVIETLVSDMENNREDMVVIVAGYTDEMKKFIRSNPGLLSRFNKHIAFEDFDVKDMMKILDSMAKKYEFKITPSANKYIKEYFYQNTNTKEKSKQFGNARGVRNLFEKAVEKQSVRLANKKNITRKDLVELDVKDFQADYAQNLMRKKEFAQALKTSNIELD